ncbi:unnamed protein product, partial [Rotaria sp. Silwood1]
MFNHLGAALAGGLGHGGYGLYHPHHYGHFGFGNPYHHGYGLGGYGAPYGYGYQGFVIYSARSRLHDRHKLQLKRKLQQIKQEQNISSNHQSTNKESEMKSFEDSENECLYAYEQAHYSPILTHINEFDIEIQKMCVDDMDDVEKLKQQRQSVMKSKSMQTNIGNISQGFVQNPNDLKAGSDTIIDTGYHWNQYNRTHYDINNPPPKIVQGYKFNIFYPNLIDKTKIPSYHLMICEDNKDFLILKFHAGPPYE